jgi:hypothetical protein
MHSNGKVCEYMREAKNLWRIGVNFSDNIVIVVDGDEAKTARDRRLQKILNIVACYLERQTCQSARFLRNVSVER